MCSAKVIPMQRRPLLIVLLLLFGLLLIKQVGTQAEMYRYQVGASNRSDQIAEIGNHVEEFFRDIREEQIDEGVETLLADSPLINVAEGVEQRAQLKRQIEQAERRYGKFLSSERVRIDRLSRSMIRAVYVLNCSQFPLVWRVTYYRSDAARKWVVVSVRFDTEYDTLPSGDSLLPRPLQ